MVSRGDYMNKEEIQKLLESTESEINRIITKAKMLSTEEITKLDHLYSDKESFKFQLRVIEQEGSKDGSK